MSWGLTLPVAGVPLGDHRDLVAALPGLGYTDVWSGEAAGTDAFTPLAVASQWAPALRLGPAIVPAFTRGPALVAMQAATMAELAPGRFVMGIGSSSPVVTSSWNAVPYDRPMHRTRDLLRFLRKALAGERVDEAFDTFEVRGFRLDRPPATVPPVMLAALRPAMLRLAVTEGDGAITNWLSADDVRLVRAEIGPDAELVARIFVIPTEDGERARQLARRRITAYLTVPAYRAFHDWLGRGPALARMHEAWSANDRRGALAAIPDEVVDDLFVWGSPEQIRAKVERYLGNGVTTAVLMIVPPDGAGDAPATDAGLLAVVRGLHPAAG